MQRLIKDDNKTSEELLSVTLDEIAYDDEIISVDTDHNETTPSHDRK